MKNNKLQNWRNLCAAALITIACGASAEPVDINLDSAERLAENIVGVGPVIADRIVAYREQNGAFESLDQLLEVPGVGEKVLERNRETILIDGKAVEN